MNTNDAKMDKVIDRIQKLLALGDANRNNSEAEADAAVKLAQKLMGQYNLDMATIEADGTVDVPGAGAERRKEKMKGRAMYKWQQGLMKYVAHANYCYHFVGTEWYETPTKWSHEYKRGYEQVDEWCGDAPGPKGQMFYKTGTWRSRPYHVLVGRKANVISAQLMFDYLCEAIERLVPIESNRQRLSRAAMSWKDGCSDRLQSRLYHRRQDHEQEQKRAAEQAATQAGTGLVLLSNYGQSERDRNWEHAHGMEVGYLDQARKRNELAAIERQKTLERIAAEEAAMLAALTPKQRAKHDAKMAKEAAKEAERQRKQQERWEKQARNRRRREAAKRDWNMYDAGSDAGNAIGLDPQVSAGSAAKRLS